MSDDEKLLVVDDDPMMVDFAQGVLTSLGYRTVAAMDAQTALRVLQQHDEIKAAMIDLRLGNGPNGARLAQDMLALRPELIVLLTSGAHGALETAGRDMPKPVGLLPKPYRRRDLAECLSGLF